MGQPKKRCSGPEMNRMAVKMGGGGIGAVVLMGGALAAAALASAFLVRKRGRSSVENRRHLCRNTPPMAANELKNYSHEQDEAKTGLQYVLLETPSLVEKHTSVARREVGESDSEAAGLVSTQILKRDENAGIEINGGRAVCVSDGEESEQILSSLSPKSMENEAISEGLVINKQVILPLVEKLKFEPKNVMHGVEIELSKEYDHYEQVFTEEKGVNMDSEEEEEKVIEKTKMDVAGDGFELSVANWSDQEKVFVASSLSEDGQEALGCNEIEHENANGDERGVLPCEILEIMGEDKAVEGTPEVEIKHVEEKLAETEECNQTHEEIVTVEETPFGDNDKNLIVSTLAAMPKEESIDVADEEVVYQQKGQEKDEEDMDDLMEGKNEAEDNITGSDDEADEDEDSSSEQADGSSSGAGDSLVEDSNQRSAGEHQQEKLINQKLEGRIEEDVAMKEETCDIQERETPTANSTRLGFIIGVLFVLSSIFCSWFLSLSSIEFCFIMFLTIVLSKASGSICTRDRNCKSTIHEPGTKAAT